MSGAFSNKQRVYYLWLVFVNARQQLDKHRGDQAWFTTRKNRLLTLTQRNGRVYDRNMSVDKMVADLVAMVIEEARDMVKSTYRKVS